MFQLGCRLQDQFNNLMVWPGIEGRDKNIFSGGNWVYLTMRGLHSDWHHQGGDIHLGKCECLHQYSCCIFGMLV